MNFKTLQFICNKIICSYNFYIILLNNVYDQSFCFIKVMFIFLL